MVLSGWVGITGRLRGGGSTAGKTIFARGRFCTSISTGKSWTNAATSDS